MAFELHRVTINDVHSLKLFSTKTFVEAFAKDNTPEDMEIYLSQAMTIEKLSAEISHPDMRFYFVLENEQPIAYIKVNAGTAQNEDIQNALEIERIYVDKDHQGRKIGAFLIEKAMSMAKDLDKEIIWLGVWDKNANAIAFYKHLGFETFGQHEFMLGHDLQTDILMKKEVGY